MSKVWFLLSHPIKDRSALFIIHSFSHDEFRNKTETSSTTTEEQINPDDLHTNSKMNSSASPVPALGAPLYDDFRAGLTACLRSWSAFRAAVEGGWGGNESLAKAEDLRNNILQHFNGSGFQPKTLTIDDLEDNLAIYMEEEFTVVLEDNSERQVADTIWRMYEQCMKGDASLARQVVDAANGVIQQSVAYPVQVQAPEDDDDDDEMMDSNDDDDDDEGMTDEVAPTLVAVGTMTNPTEYASQFLFGPPRPVRSVVVDEKPPRQLGDAPIEEPVVEVDEDGFAPVVKRKGRKD